MPCGGNSTQPLFCSDHIADWLDGRPVPDTDESDRVRDYGTRFRENLRVRALTSRLSGDTMIRAGLALVALRTVIGRPLPRDVSDILELAREVEAGRADLAGLFRDDLTVLDDVAGPSPVDASLVTMVEELAVAAGSAVAAERIMALTDKVGSTLRSSITPSRIADLVGELVGPLAGRSVLDPAAGTGNLLLAVLGRDRGVTGQVRAADHDAGAIRLLRQRMICHQIPIDVLCGDSLRGWPDGRADIVITDPPFQPGESASEVVSPMDWVEATARNLASGGRGYVVVPAWTLTHTEKRFPAVRTRQQLLRARIVAGVVQLPRRAHPFRTGAELCVVVVVPVGEPADAVVFCDADRVAAEDRDGWPERVAKLVGESDPARPDTCRRISVGELDEAASLLPAHRLVEPAVRVDHLAAVSLAGDAVRQAFPEGVPIGTPPPLRAGRDPRFRTVGQLRLAGRLELLAGHRIAPADLGTEGHVVIGAEELTGASTPGLRRTTRIPTTRQREAFTVAGDVILLAEGGIHTRVDESGGTVVLSPARILRIRGHSGVADGPSWMLPHLLARLLAAPRNVRRESGSTVRRVSLNELELPILDPEGVAVLDTWIRQCDGAQAELRERLDALEWLTVSIAAGVADGALTARADPPIETG